MSSDDATSAADAVMAESADLQSLADSPMEQDESAGKDVCTDDGTLHDTIPGLVQTSPLKAMGSSQNGDTPMKEQEESSDIQLMDIADSGENASIYKCLPTFSTEVSTEPSPRARKDGSIDMTVSGTVRRHCTETITISAPSSLLSESLHMPFSISSVNTQQNTSVISSLNSKKESASIPDLSIASVLPSSQVYVNLAVVPYDSVKYNSPSTASITDRPTKSSAGTVFFTVPPKSKAAAFAPASNVSTESSVFSGSNAAIIASASNVSTESSVSSGSNAAVIAPAPNVSTESSVSSGSNAAIIAPAPNVSTESSVSSGSKAAIVAPASNVSTESSVSSGSNAAIVAPASNVSTESSVSYGSKAAVVTSVSSVSSPIPVSSTPFVALKSKVVVKSGSVPSSTDVSFNTSLSPKCSVITSAAIYSTISDTQSSVFAGSISELVAHAPACKIPVHPEFNLPSDSETSGITTIISPSTCLPFESSVSNLTQDYLQSSVSFSSIAEAGGASNIVPDVPVTSAVEHNQVDDSSQPPVRSNSPPIESSSRGRARVTRSQNPEFAARQRSFIREYRRSVGSHSSVLSSSASTDVATSTALSQKPSQQLVSGSKSSISANKSRVCSEPGVVSESRCSDRSVASDEVEVIEELCERDVDQSCDETGAFSNNDNFCWVCHREGKVVCCETCPRVYHLKCTQLSSYPPDDWVCIECRRIVQAENVSNLSNTLRTLPQKQLVQLLTHAVRRLKGLPGAEPFTDPVDPDKFPQYREVVACPMNLLIMEENVKKGVYGSTEAFIADCKWIVHNCILYNGNNSKLTTLSKSLLRMCKWEMEEIETCPDCYGNAYADDSWFTLACPNPHLLIWARLKGFPFWPAKAMKTRDGNVDCRFFGRHDRAWVPIKECFLFSKEPPCQPKSRSKSLDGCIEELELHVLNLEQRFGSYVYAKSRTQFDPRKVHYHLKMCIPGLEQAQRTEQETAKRKRLSCSVEGDTEASADQADCQHSVPPDSKKARTQSEAKVDASSNAAETRSDTAGSPAATAASSTNAAHTGSPAFTVEHDAATCSSHQTREAAEPDAATGSFHQTQETPEPSAAEDSSPQTQEAPDPSATEGSSHQAQEAPKPIAATGTSHQTQEAAREELSEPPVDSAPDAAANIAEGARRTDELCTLGTPGDGRTDESAEVTADAFHANDAGESHVKSPGSGVSCKTTESARPAVSKLAVSTASVKSEYSKVAAAPASSPVYTAALPSSTSTPRARGSTASVGRSPAAAVVSPSVASQARARLSAVTPTVRLPITSPRSNGLSRPVGAPRAAVPTQRVRAVAAPSLGGDSQFAIVSPVTLGPMMVIPSAAHSPSMAQTTRMSGLSRRSPLLTAGADAAPPGQGSVSAELQKQAKNLTDMMRSSLEKVLNDLCMAGSPQATIANLKLQLERMQWKHQMELAEQKKVADSMLAEVRSSMDMEQKRSLQKLTTSFAAERRELERRVEMRIAETKKKQWCANCGKEAIFYCCWNTSYCDFPCQEAQWPKHMMVCANQQGHSQLAADGAGSDSSR